MQKIRKPTNATKAKSTRHVRLPGLVIKQMAATFRRVRLVQGLCVINFQTFLGIFKKI
jgi:hypothetical protein